ncbi:MAG: hypothetical protein JO117_05625 [Verrucomicrobia bacterium]|nr:hypothetical protein [Verrucomicrobiota bacterium]
MKSPSIKKVTQRKKARPTTAENLEEKFDNGEDVLDYFDTKNPILRGPEIERLEVELPGWIVSGLDQEAARLGVTRDALLKFWVAARLDERRKGELASR